MRWIKVFALWMALAASMFLVGCAQVPMADASQDAALKKFPPPKAGMASLYMYRNETFGGAIKQSLVLDGMNVGQTGPKTYFHTDIAPGRHTLISQGENTDTLVLEAIAGRRYFVQQEIKMGAFQARTQLNLVTEDVGRKGVLESSLAASGLPPARAAAAATPAAPPSAPALSAPLAAAPARVAGRYAGRWTGSLLCGPSTGANAQQQGFEAPTQMTIDNGMATHVRRSSNYSETLHGTIAADGTLTLVGQGAMAQSQNLPWTTRLEGRFIDGASRFEASGTLVGANKILNRACTLDMRPAAAP